MERIGEGVFQPNTQTKPLIKSGNPIDPGRPTASAPSHYLRLIELEVVPVALLVEHDVALADVLLVELVAGALRLVLGFEEAGAPAVAAAVFGLAQDYAAFYYLELLEELGDLFHGDFPGEASEFGGDHVGGLDYETGRNIVWSVYNAPQAHNKSQNTSRTASSHCNIYNPAHKKPSKP